MREAGQPPGAAFVGWFVLRATGDAMLMQTTRDLPAGLTPVVLASYPRSGNTFVRQVLLEAFGLTTFTVYPDEWMTKRFGGYVGDSDLESVPVVIVKTHDMLDDWEGNWWHVVRDGRDAVASHRRFNMSAHESSNDEWSKCVTDFDALAGHTTRFEDLMEDPIGAVRSGLSSFGLLEAVPQISNEITQFAELQEINGRMWRRGQTGNWRTELEDFDRFERLNGETLRSFGYA